MQIRAVAIDPAGNAGPVAGFPYTVLAPPAPAGPAAGRPASGRAALAVRSLAAPRLIRAAQVRRAGLRLTMNVPRGTRVVRVRVFRATASGRRAGRTLVNTRLVPRRAGRFVITLRNRALQRPGRYRVEITPGRSVKSFGRTSVKLVRVTR
jgi:hypothetical protein